MNKERLKDLQQMLFNLGDINLLSYREQDIDIYYALKERAIEFINADRGCIIRVLRESSSFEFIDYDCNVPAKTAELFCLARSSTRYKKVLEDGIPQVFDCRTKMPKNSKVGDAKKIQRELIVPIYNKNSGNITYLLVLAFFSRNKIYTNDLMILQMLADHFSFVEYSTVNIRSLHELLRVTESIISTNELGDIYNVVTEALTSVFNCRYAHILLTEYIRDNVSKSNIPRLAIAHTTDDRLQKNATFDVDEGFSGWVISNDAFLLASNLSTDVREYPIVSEGGFTDVVRPQSFKEEETDKCLLAVPLRVNGLPSGVIMIASDDDGEAFNSEDDPLLLQLFADQCAIAIKRASLYQRITHEKMQAEDRLSRLNSGGELIFSAELAYTHTHQIKHRLLEIINNFTAYTGLANQLLDLYETRRRFFPKRGVDVSLVQKHRDTLGKRINETSRLAKKLASKAQIFKYSPRLWNVKRVLKKIISDKRSYVHDIDLTVNIANADVPTYLDRFLLGEALGNVIVNACQAVDSVPKKRKRIEISARAHVRHIRIDITDYGAGINPKFLPDRIFEPFFSTKDEGTGIGLFMTRRIIEDKDYHGGKIWASSKEHARTTFHIKLPRRKSR